MTQTQSANSSAIPVVVNKVNGKNVYPPEAIVNYMDVCTKAGGVKEECKCFITKAQDFYTLDELIKINRDVSSGKSNPEKISSITSQCEKQKPKKVVAEKETKPVITTTYSKQAEDNTNLCSDLYNKYKSLRLKKTYSEEVADTLREFKLDSNKETMKALDIKRQMLNVEIEYSRNNCS